MDARDDLEDLLDELEAARPGARDRIEELGAVFRTTTRLRQQRERLGLTVERVAECSGLTLNQVDLVEDNAVDCPYDVLHRYAKAVGLEFDLRAIVAA